MQLVAMQSIGQVVEFSLASQMPSPQPADALQTPAEHVPPGQGDVLKTGPEQPATGLQALSVQTLPSSHGLVPPGMQTLFRQLSPWVHALLSLQVEPLGLPVHELPPEQSGGQVNELSPGSQMPLPHLAVLTQSFGQEVDVSPASHVPLPQLPTQRFCWTVQLEDSHAEIVHKSPVVQVTPLAKGVTVQPVIGLQPSLVQLLPSSHWAGIPMQLPAELQTSPVVHALPSLQDVPAASNVMAQMLSSPHLSVVQEFLSSHWTSSVHATHLLLPEVQTLPTQTSPCVHALPSSQPIPLATVCVQPFGIMQASIVQELPSSQESTLLTHMPPKHVSAVHGLLSVQVEPSGRPVQGPVLLQSFGHVMGVSVPEQMPSPHVPPQSGGQVLGLSPASQMPLPHTLPGQSCGQVAFDSPASHMPLPQVVEAEHLEEMQLAKPLKIGVVAGRSLVVQFFWHV